MSALRAVFKTHLPLSSVRIGTHSIAAVKTERPLTIFQLSNNTALTCRRSVSNTVQSSPDKVEEARKVKEGDEAEEDQGPVKFTTSRAAAWRAEHTWKGSDEDVPEIQPLVVSLSMAALLVYFCLLREENDVDQKLVKDLEDYL
ncbi:uncharacterized protein LOC111052043 isoform X1 [Nilaparvata lugens]|uniref:uncharacterized protein LOC111052043 isoform X1 n=1 Tax=Nilaparvata lugens TaxID=108931 RepID=UPI00193DA73E|nr:uncharacterized protein LOC111052043 isoform X1 [Nilaparvata lugens]